MRKHKLLAGILAAALVVTSFPASLLPADKAKAAVTPVETTIQKTEVSNPVLGEKDGNLLYGGDPSIFTLAAMLPRPKHTLCRTGSATPQRI